MLNLYSKNRRQAEADSWRSGEMVTGHDRFSRARIGIGSGVGKRRVSSPATFPAPPVWRKQKILQRKKRRQEVAGLEVAPLSTTTSSYDVSAGQANESSSRVGSPLLGGDGHHSLIRRFQELLCLRHDDQHGDSTAVNPDGSALYHQLISTTSSTTTIK